MVHVPDAGAPAESRHQGEVIRQQRIVLLSPPAIARRPRSPRCLLRGLNVVCEQSSMRAFEMLQRHTTDET